jgi:hypothetical protein
MRMLQTTIQFKITHQIILHFISTQTGSKLWLNLFECSIYSAFCIIFCQQFLKTECSETFSLSCLNRENNPGYSNPPLISIAGDAPKPYIVTVISLLQIIFSTSWRKSPLKHNATKCRSVECR